jgi:cytochrome c peroxidase
VQVSAFSSKFDAFLAGKYKLTPEEMAGFQLFNGRATAIHATSTEDEPHSSLAGRSGRILSAWR